MICFCQCKLSQTREGGYIFSHHLIKLRKPIGSAEFLRGGGEGSVTSSSCFLFALFCAGNLFPRAFPSHFRRKEVGTRLPRRYMISEEGIATGGYFAICILLWSLGIRTRWQVLKSIILITTIRGHGMIVIKNVQTEEHCIPTKRNAETPQTLCFNSLY